MKTEKLIPLPDFVLLNRRGYPCSTSWKYRLIREGKFPYKTIIDNYTTYVVINEQKKK